jgi:hypothetical protein
MNIGIHQKISSHKTLGMMNIRLIMTMLDLSQKTYHCRQYLIVCKESYNLNETTTIGMNDENYLEYENLKDFRKWTLSLKP